MSEVWQGPSERSNPLHIPRTTAAVAQLVIVVVGDVDASECIERFEQMFSGDADHPVPASLPPVLKDGDACAVRAVVRRAAAPRAPWTATTCSGTSVRGGSGD
mgnify:CR=1 FL=1